MWHNAHYQAAYTASRPLPARNRINTCIRLYSLAPIRMACECRERFFFSLPALSLSPAANQSWTEGALNNAQRGTSRFFCADPLRNRILNAYTPLPRSLSLSLYFSAGSPSPLRCVGTSRCSAANKSVRSEKHSAPRCCEYAHAEETALSAHQHIEIRHIRTCIGGHV